MSYLENSVAISQVSVPSVFLGSRELIKRLSDVEAILEKKIEKNYIKKNSSANLAKESIASLVQKCGTRNTYSDIYKFIK